MYFYYFYTFFYFIFTIFIFIVSSLLAPSLPADSSCSLISEPPPPDPQQPKINAITEEYIHTIDSQCLYHINRQIEDENYKRQGEREFFIEEEESRRIEIIARGNPVSTSSNLMDDTVFL